MLRRNHHRRGSIDRVDACRKHTNLSVGVFDFEIDISAFTASDPIALALDHFCRPAALNLIYVSNELFGVLRRSQIPLFDFFLRYLCSAPPADAARRRTPNNSLLT